MAVLNNSGKTAFLGAKTEKTAMDVSFIVFS